jgi:hypothetical protein
MSRATGSARPAGFGLTVRTSSGREFEVELDYDDDRAMVAGLLETVEYVDATFVGYDVAPVPKARTPKEPTAKPATRAKRAGGGQGPADVRPVRWRRAQHQDLPRARPAGRSAGQDAARADSSAREGWC